MIEDIPILTARMDYATGRINKLKVAVNKNVSPNGNDVCVYITGSHGRKEAHESSDLDLFFIREGSQEHNGVSRVDKALFDASLIKTARKLKFPEFTKGGAYLDIHYLDDILDVLGSPEDDYRNFFTARMLLLLESVPILHDGIYGLIIERIVDSYYRDYHDHEVHFRPAFLVNDIHRYWITMCLNYEHARNRENRTRAEKNKAHLKNVKLKFSRLMTCYSMIVPILSSPGTITPEEVAALVRRTPIGRLLDVAQEHPALADTVRSVLSHYSWFLEQTGKPEDEALAWIARKPNRNRAFNKARDFGRSMFKLVTETASDTEKLRYLIV